MVAWSDIINWRHDPLLDAGIDLGACRSSLATYALDAGSASGAIASTGQAVSQMQQTLKQPDCEPGLLRRPGRQAGHGHR